LFFKYQNFKNDTSNLILGHKNKDNKLNFEKGLASGKNDQISRENEAKNNFCKLKTKLSFLDNLSPKRNKIIIKPHSASFYKLK
jgi:hypothetical protein